MKKISMMIMMVLVMGLLFNGCGYLAKPCDFDSPALYTFYGTVVSVDEDFTIVKFDRYVSHGISNGQEVVERDSIYAGVRFFTNTVEKGFMEGQNVYVQCLSRMKIDQERFQKFMEGKKKTARAMSDFIHVLPPEFPELPENSPVGAK